MIFFFLALDFNIKLSKKSITVGEPLKITIQWDDTFRLHPSFQESLMIEVLKETFKREKGKTTGIWEVTSYSPGEKTMNFHKRGDTTALAQVNFSVESVLTGKERDISDVKPPLSMFNPIYLLFLLLLTIIPVILWIKKRKRPRRIEKVEEIPPLEEALKGLKDIKPLVESDLKLFFTKLSEIFRRYIERRFEIRAIEATTSEIAHNIKKKRLKDLEQIIPWLREWDLYKFTEIKPQKERGVEYLKKVEEFVNASG